MKKIFEDNHDERKTKRVRKPRLFDFKFLPKVLSDTLVKSFIIPSYER